MIATDREWLRFVSFALLVGCILGTLFTGVFIGAGRPYVHSLVAAIGVGGGLTMVVHLAMRSLVDASEPSGDPDPEADA